MQHLQLRESVKVGDVFQVVFANEDRPRPSFMAMVVEHYGDAVNLRDIKLDNDGEVSEASERVSQASLELPKLRRGRRILRPHPEYRRWADDANALLSFGGKEPRVVPTGLDLDGLARYEEGAFILAENPPATQLNTAACYRRPFYDYLGSQVVRQRVTVFEVDGGGKMEHRRHYASSEKYRLALPDDVTFTQVDEGPVLYSKRELLMLGKSLACNHVYSLHGDKYFAMETRVLEHAGLIVPGVN